MRSLRTCGRLNLGNPAYLIAAKTNRGISLNARCAGELDANLIGLYLADKTRQVAELEYQPEERNHRNDDKDPDDHTASSLHRFVIAHCLLPFKSRLPLADWSVLPSRNSSRIARRG